MKEQLLDELKELAKAILEDTTLSSENIKERALQLLESATILAYAEKKELEAILLKKSKVAESSLKFKPKKIVEEVSEDLIVLGTTDIPEKNNEEVPEVLPTFDIEAKVLDISFEPATHQESSLKNNEDSTSEVPELLHELENLTSDAALPHFEASENKDSAQQSKMSLNDTLNKGFQLGLNDRLAFVNNLFNGSNEDLTRVISQLNTKENLAEAQEFVSQIVKPEYNNWEGKEAFEIRFLELVERNFEQ